MKIFFFALREYDELQFVEQYSKLYDFTYDYTPDYPTLENAELAKGYDALSIITNPMYPEILDKFYSLGIRAISTRSIGYDHIDLEYAGKIGMKISHVTYSPNSVANYTIMLMLMACRKEPFILSQAAGQNFALQGKMGREISLSTVGIIGTGKIGETVARHLSGFGCKMLAYDLYPKDSLRDIVEYVNLDTLYAESDIITLHAPGLPENHHMIDGKAMEKMKDGVILINAARGSLIDTEALICGLESKKIGAAALDTFENETGLYYLNKEQEIMKNRDRAILNSFPNVILSPHMAFYTEQAVSDMVGNSIRGLLNFAKDEPNPFAVQ